MVKRGFRALVFSAHLTILCREKFIPFSPFNPFPSLISLTRSPFFHFHFYKTLNKRNLMAAPLHLSFVFLRLLVAASIDALVLGFP